MCTKKTLTEQIHKCTIFWGSHCRIGVTSQITVLNTLLLILLCILLLPCQPLLLLLCILFISCNSSFSSALYFYFVNPSSSSVFSLYLVNSSSSSVFIFLLCQLLLLCCTYLTLFIVFTVDSECKAFLINVKYFTVGFLIFLSIKISQFYRGKVFANKQKYLAVSNNLGT